MIVTKSLASWIALLAAIGCATTFTVWQVIPAYAQGRPAQGSAAQAPVAKGDWPLHNLDLANSRYSTLDQINASNASKLVQKWSFDLPDKTSMGSATPIVVDGVMYLNSGRKIYALDAATGKQLWTTEMQHRDEAIGGRGPLYADGKIYAFGHRYMYAVNAKDGKPVESFGDKGVLDPSLVTLQFKDEKKYANDFNPESIGYMVVSSPTYHAGTIYLGLAQSDSIVPGGFLTAFDATTGGVKWAFRTLPQGPKDDGWDLMKGTWSDQSAIYGGGIWTQPAIDLELGLIYANVGNPSPNLDGSARKGTNLFTNSIIALDLATGKLKWYQQALHHDIWDWDLAGGPTLFDFTLNGKTVKGIASLAKTCYVYALNRETGKPFFPWIETAVPTATDVPGEEVWPTQPIPYTARNTPQTPYCWMFPPELGTPELTARRRPTFTPYRTGELIIVSPGLQGGGNRGSSSFSPRTGWLYVTGKNDAWSVRVKPVGNTLKPAAGSPGHYGNIIEEGPLTGLKATQSVAAFDPATGDLAWIVELPVRTQSGNLVTAGDVLFQESAGTFYTLDARTGKQLSTIKIKSPLGSNPLTYLAGGQQYVAIGAGGTVVSFGLQ